MARVQYVAGAFLLLVVLSGVTATAFVVSDESFDGFRIPFVQPAQGDKPGVVPPGTNATTGPNYVDVEFRIECVASWCDVPDGESLVFRIQQANRSEFEWEGLYAFGVRDGSSVDVKLFVGQRYRLLVKHPDGRIIYVGDYVAERDSVVTVRLTPEAAR